MIKDVHAFPITDVFKIGSDKLYKIPKYQRQYTWGIREWDALFNDILENDNGYFLGSFICVNNSSMSNIVLELIDGQQRFTTLTLLLVALYSKLNSLKEEMDDEERTDLANLKNMLAIKNYSYAADGTKKVSYSQRLLLQKQNSNDEDFNYILSSNEIISFNYEKPSNHGNRRICKAYKHFIKLIDEEIERKKEEGANKEIDILFALTVKFKLAVMVGIEVDTNKDAYMLFESLNHRGVPLSAIDLIKNTLIAQSESKGDADICYDKWKQILRNIGEDEYSVQERFFRQYYNSFREELNEPYKNKTDKKYYLGYLATRTTILDIYEQMIKDDYDKLLTDLLDKSRTYEIITNKSEEEISYSSSLLNLERIQGAPSYILLLYIMSNKEKLELDDNRIKTIVDILIVFFVRRSLTDVPGTRKLTQLFIDIISEIKIIKGDDIVIKIHDELEKISASNGLFEEKLRGPIYDENPETTRFILCSIEEQHQTKEIYSDLWKRDNSNKYIWTIEHIFPEGDKIPEEWVEMIANGDIELAKKYRIDYVHTLGNLTVTGYNSNLSNMSFDKKKNRMSKDKTKYIGYKNGLYLNKDVVSEDYWEIAKIKVRTDKLVDIVLDMYKW